MTIHIPLATLTAALECTLQSNWLEPFLNLLELCQTTCTPVNNLPTGWPMIESPQLYWCIHAIFASLDWISTWMISLAVVRVTDTLTTNLFWSSIWNTTWDTDASNNRDSYTTHSTCQVHGLQPATWHSSNATCFPSLLVIGLCLTTPISSVDTHNCTWHDILLLWWNIFV